MRPFNEGIRARHPIVPVKDWDFNRTPINRIHLDTSVAIQDLFE